MVKLRDKQKKFVKAIARNDNGTQAIIDAGYNVKDRIVAKSMAAENLAKPYIYDAVEQERKTLAEKIPDDLVTERHIELLNKRETKRTFNPDIGEWIEIETGAPDTMAVSKGLDMAYKLKGSYAAEKHVNVDIEVKPSERIMELAHKLKKVDN